MIGEEAFGDWGWRIPFLISLLLLLFSVYIRMKLSESPIFKKMKEEGKGSKAPLTEVFRQWGNLKIVLLALFGLTAGQAVVWYTGQFYALFFLTQTLKVDATTANLLIAALAPDRHAVLHLLRLAVGQDRAQAHHPGRLPDRGAHLLPGVQGDHALRQSGARGGASELRRSTVVADPATCSFQFNPVGTTKFTVVLRHRQELPGEEAR